MQRAPTHPRTAVTAAAGPPRARVRRAAPRAAALTLQPAGGGELVVVEVPEVGGGSAVGATAEKLVVLGGSAEEADVALPAAAGLEARHATLACRAGKFFLTDASSATGTTMQGAKLMPGVSYLLGDGNVISFGEAEYEVKIEGKGLDKPPSMEETLMRQMVEQKLKEAEENIRRKGGGGS